MGKNIQYITYFSHKWGFKKWPGKGGNDTLCLGHFCSVGQIECVKKAKGSKYQMGKLNLHMYSIAHVCSTRKKYNWPEKSSVKHKNENCLKTMS